VVGAARGRSVPALGGKRTHQEIMKLGQILKQCGCQGTTKGTGVTMGITMGVVFGIVFGMTMGITMGIVMGIAMGVAFGASKKSKCD
jgi:hypothetical protein